MRVLVFRLPSAIPFFFWALTPLFAALLLGCSPQQAPQANTYEVTRVLDGDTFELASHQKVRLLGVDAPETQHHLESVRELGKASKEHLNRLILGKGVRIEEPPGTHDPYGRTLAYVYLSDGTLVNQAMIEDGFAVPYTKYPCSKTSGLLQAASIARSNQRGLWAHPNFSQEGRYEVRLSISGICHAPGNKGFERMKRYTAYRSLEACIDSGGRLPRNARNTIAVLKNNIVKDGGI